MLFLLSTINNALGRIGALKDDFDSWRHGRAIDKSDVWVEFEAYFDGSTDDRK